MNDNQSQNSNDNEEPQIPAWKLLQDTVHGWAVMSKHYEVLENYFKLQEQHK